MQANQMQRHQAIPPLVQRRLESARRSAVYVSLYRRPGGMKRTEPAGDDTRQSEGRPISRDRRQSSVDSGQALTSKDRRAYFAPESQALAPDSEDDVVVLADDGGSNENWRPPPLKSEPIYTTFACTKCTFENTVQGSSAVASAQSPPSLLCEVCNQPLLRQQQQHRDYPLHLKNNGSRHIDTSSDSVSVLAESRSRHGLLQAGSRHDFNNEDGRGGSRARIEPQITAADFLPAYTNDEVPGVECRSCTVIVPAGLDTRQCPVCLAPLNGSTSTTGQLLEGWLPSLECTACTLRNEPGSTICSACETPLDGGQIGSQRKSPQWGTQEGRHGKRQKQETAITTTLELRGRTAEEGGDKQACTNGLIPKIHRRLRDQYPNAHRKQGQTACWNAGARGQARTAKASSASSRGTSTPRPPQGGGRGARDWLSASGKERSSTSNTRDLGNGAGNSRGGAGAGGRGAGAEWRLCDPSVAHCSQRNAPGSEYSCGYRNIQMLCSALMDIPEYRRVLFGGSGCVPGVLLMQCWLERAWADGYDPDGCEQLGGAGSLVGSEKWIGATECATLLRSFGVKAEVIDFETDTSVRARTRDSRGQAPASQENRRPPRTGDQDIPATQHQEQNNEPDRGHNQPSLLSYWSSPPGNGGHKLGTDEGSSRITGGNGVVSVHGNVVVDATTDVAPAAEPTPAVSCTVCEVVVQTARKRDADHGDRGGCHGGVVAQPVENGVEEDVVMCQRTSDNDNHDNDDDDDNDGDRDEGKDKNDNRNNDENQRGMDEKAPTPTPASGGPDTATHIARDEADACSDRSTRGPLRGLTGGRGNGHLEFPYGSASGRAAPVATGGRQQRGRGEGGRGGRGRGRGQALRASSSSSNSNTSNASAMMGTGCGQAVVEWAWDYFCTPWNVGGEEESLVGKSESSSAAAVGYSRGGKSCVSDKSDTEQAHGRPTVPREVRSSIQDEKEEMTAYFLDFLCSGDSAGACDGGAGRSSTRDDEQVRGRPRRQDGGERSSAGISRRLPPPLYLQHDGHSRTVVGVLWPQGRSTAGLGGDAATSRGRRSGSGSVGRECARRCPGSLLVFDPSHAGSELRGALANEGNMRWCSFVKRGVRSLRRQQFQMVAVRPGLVDPSEAGMWKKIVATKVRVPDGALSSIESSSSSGSGSSSSSSSR